MRKSNQFPPKIQYNKKIRTNTYIDGLTTKIDTINMILPNHQFNEYNEPTIRMQMKVFHIKLAQKRCVRKRQVFPKLYSSP